MSKREIASLAFKLAGIYALVAAAGYLGGTVPALGLLLWQASAPADFAGAMAITCGSSLSVFLLLAGLGVFLIARSGKLAARMFPAVAEDDVRERVAGIPALAYSVVGLALLATGVPTLISHIVMTGFVGAFSWGRLIPEACESLARIAIGVGLFLGGRRLAEFWTRLRYVGLRRQMGLCRRCGYDLAGNVSGICPECGTPVTGEGNDKCRNPNDEAMTKSE